MLRAEEIEVRPATVKDGKATLLLYIDSRAVVDILNETVGEMNWTMEFTEAAGNAVGRMGIWDEDKNMFVFKSDTGSESNIEASKGLFSDCYKRCLARWGVSELYSAPRIVVNSEDKYMTYSVRDIAYNGNREIAKLTIVNKFNKVVFEWKEGTTYKLQTPKEENLNYEEETPQDRIAELKNYCSNKKTEEGINMEALKKFFNFYSSQDKDNPNLTIAETRKYWNVDKMWSKWIANEK